MEKRWKIKTAPEPSEVTRLSAELNQLDLTLTTILLQRGITGFDAAKHYFRPDLNDIHDPFLMKDMDKAVERLQSAMDNQEKILIYGDYDVDGTTSVAMVYSYLKHYYSELDYYIPDRYSEGYGVSYQGIDFAAENGFTLIIALDCGIKAVEKVDYAKSKGVDFIICDHHRPGDVLPAAAAVLDPKREDCPYHYDGLSGCGVGFKLLHAWTLKNELDEAPLYELIDLLAISTCADIVPITGENRIFVYHGLKKINDNPRLSIQVMKELADLRKPEMTVMDVVFTFAPRINAAGRISSGRKAVEMLVAEDRKVIEEVGKKINQYNDERKGLDKSITAEALSFIDDDEVLQGRKSTVLYKEDWHKGVIGIVASRLIETHYKPTIILTESNGKVTGSARTVEGFDVYAAIDACSDLLEQFGGHTAAAGLTLKKENVEAFIHKFEEVVNEQIDDELLMPLIEIDAELEFSQINDKFYRVLKQFAPFGPANMRPVFKTENVLVDYVGTVGDNHLKMTVFQEDDPNNKFSCIGFNLGKYADELAPGVPFSIVYNLEENFWNGQTTLQLNVKDLKV
ncbi:MAG: single-stranded-DNA-specific exonuclease RecJ [Flavobacteriales bacterium]|nr:single-stranded-DNA-specific exonuclease RecJ [Flavobacteriales bacterium]